MVKHKYLYFHKFEWLNPNGADDFNGEPRQGSVYRAEDHRKFYRVILLENQEYIGFHLEKDLMVGEYDNWECDVEVITPENLFDLDISNKDLKMMAQDSPLPTATADDENEARLLDDLGSSLFMLKDFDEDMYEAVTKVTTLVSDAMSSPSYIQLTEGLSWDDRVAKHSNIAITTYLLESYLNEKDVMKISDLINAIYQLTLEVSRIHKIGKQMIEIENSKNA